MKAFYELRRFIMTNQLYGETFQKYNEDLNLNAFKNFTSMCTNSDCKLLVEKGGK